VYHYLIHTIVSYYNTRMIQSFKDKRTKRICRGEHERRISTEIARRARMRLQRVDAAATVRDLRVPPSHRLEKLTGDRAGQWSIRINDQYRVCFEFRGGDAYEIEITDYH
jgi:proteic killer suppression protein